MIKPNDSIPPPSPTTNRVSGDFTDDRCSQLHKLSREHNDGLVFAERIARIAEEGTDADLANGIALVQEYNNRELEGHLQHEEQTILGPLVQGHREHMDLCITLGKEHGYIRTLVEQMRPETARKDLADFARILRDHTLLEEAQLFPLLETLFTEEQLAAVMNHEPLRRGAPIAALAPVSRGPGVERDDQWLSLLEQHHREQGESGGTIVLFPRYRPDLVTAVATRLGLDLFDYQKEVMEGLGLEAEAITLEQLDQTLKVRAEAGGFVCHNIEALLCVKTEAERRTWLRSFLDIDWPTHVLLPIAVYQAEVPDEDSGVCDLELVRLPAPSDSNDSNREERIRYDCGL